MSDTEKKPRENKSPEELKALLATLDEASEEEVDAALEGLNEDELNTIADLADPTPDLTRAMVQHALAGEPLEFSKAFNDVMANKVQNVIGELRTAVAHNIFSNGWPDDDDDDDDDDEKTPLDKPEGEPPAVQEPPEAA